jgi:hypothetical protein
MIGRTFWKRASVHVFFKSLWKKSGHSLNHALLKKLSANKGHWKKVALDKQEKGSTEGLKIPVFSPLERVPA